MSGAKRVTAEEDARRRQLHSYGMSDVQIAERCRCVAGSIAQWRTVRALAANRPKGGKQPISRKEGERRMALYRLGWSDTAIGEAVGRKHNAIRLWRRANGLPSRYVATAERGIPRSAEAEEERRMALYNRGLCDREIADDVGRKRHAIEMWRWRRGLPLNVPEHEWQRPPTTIVSMDADLGEGGFNRHALIADDAAAEWLEENGATRW